MEMWLTTHCSKCGRKSLWRRLAALLGALPACPLGERSFPTGHGKEYLVKAVQVLASEVFILFGN